jgi:hypothetical protein
MYKYGIFLSNRIKETLELVEVIESKNKATDYSKAFNKVRDSNTYDDIVNNKITFTEAECDHAIHLYLVEFKTSGYLSVENVLDSWHIVSCSEFLFLEEKYLKGVEFETKIDKEVSDFNNKEKYLNYFTDCILGSNNKNDISTLVYESTCGEYVCSFGNEHYMIDALFDEGDEGVEFIYTFKEWYEKTGETFGFETLECEEPVILNLQ